ncbi:hypothetical protein [Streptacidiphilus jiangxiensis]|uniref:Uncharacterized protein n=1 Tax=Streptacidiphilus jiangxiensis TaxID=235985 RepID=A0A1H7Y9W7_STRJI|nr:hypothetical protein [Streptacidiphilus jiangxiensis]SEM42664.1 hypothetical protein SAMN05414137_12782 [Streptacidiphilus jiangxiensis]
MTQNKPSQAERRRIAQEKIAAQRAAESRRQRTILISMIVGGVILLGGVVGVTVWAINGQNASNVQAAKNKQASDPSIDKNANLLASTAHQAYGQDIDGIVKSNDMEQTVYHIHSHLQVYVDGKLMTIPYGLGIEPPYQLQQAQDGTPFVGGGSKFYFLHTHDESGIIHVESPSQQTYNLGNLFDLWGQPLTSTDIAGHQGQLTIFVDGKPYTGDPRAIVFKNLEKIQIDVGTAVPYKDFTWPSGY